MTKTVYSYDRDTGEYRGEAVAHENPRRPGSYLLPAFSTETAPPPVGEHEAAVYRDGAWSIVPDWRGHIYWLADGSRHQITELGVEPPADALDEEPPRPLADRQLDTWDRIKAERIRRQLEGGFLVDGKWWFHSDNTSRIQQMQLKAQAKDMLADGASEDDPLQVHIPGQPAPIDLQWKTMTGERVLMTVGLALKLESAAVGTEALLHAVADQHRAAMMQRPDPENYDFSGGWPLTFWEWDAQQQAAS